MSWRRFWPIWNRYDAPLFHPRPALVLSQSRYRDFYGCACGAGLWRATGAADRDTAENSERAGDRCRPLFGGYG